MGSRRIDRRTVLRGLLGGAAITVGLPPLEIFMNAHGTAYAQSGDTGFPRRFGVFFWGNGMLPERWIPEGTGADWVPSDQLAPLAHLRDVITVVTGMGVQIPNASPHGSGFSGFLAGGSQVNVSGSLTMPGPTVDQIIAREIGGETRFPSLEVGSDPGSGISFNGPNSPNPAEGSPHALFERVFGGGFTLPGETPIVDPSVALRRSVLDAVMEQARALQGQIGVRDQARLDQHFEGIRALERRLARLEEDPPNLAACALPPEPEPEYPPIEGRAQIRAKNRAICDILALALACDQTRVFTNTLTHPVSDVLYPGISAGHHQLTHDEPGEQLEVHGVTLQIIEELAYQFEALGRIEEGDGTLLDSCAVIATSEVSLGREHSIEEMPIIIGGSCGGRIRNGIHYRAPGGDNASKVMLSLIRAMGVDAGTFGLESARTGDGLSEIEA